MVNSREELHVSLNTNTKTVRVFDQFEGISGGPNKCCFEKKKYERMVIDTAILSREKYYCNLVIERKKGRQCVGDVTMTELKMGECRKLRRYISIQIKYSNVDDIVDKDEVLLFDKPYLLRAQNRYKRAGYKNSGAQYGETEDYCIIGVYLHRRYTPEEIHEQLVKLGIRNKEDNRIHEFNINDLISKYKTYGKDYLFFTGSVDYGFVFWKHCETDSFEKQERIINKLRKKYNAEVLLWDDLEEFLQHYNDHYEQINFKGKENNGAVILQGTW